MDFSNRPTGCRTSPRRVLADLENLILQLRRELKETSDLGEFGAPAILEELLKRGVEKPPSVRSIGRILLRRGALDGKRRIRRPAPPPGWYFPDLAAYETELDSFDIIEGLRIENGPLVDVLTGISLHGGLTVAWPTEAQISAKWVLERLIEHWRCSGLPDYAQFDNDTRFQGPHQYQDVLGSVTRLCLQLGVVPIFVPQRETGFQAAIESFNGRWQRSVWSRFHHESLTALQTQSDRFITAHRARNEVRIGRAPMRRPFPEQWDFAFRAKPRGRLIYMRRTNERGWVNFLGHDFLVSETWLHRLVRCEVDLDAHQIRFVALRRQCPLEQPLLNKIHFRLHERSSS